MKMMGRKHRPFFRICAIDSRNPRDGRVLEELGTYDPMVPDTDARALAQDRADRLLAGGRRAAVGQGQRADQEVRRRGHALGPAASRPASGWRMPKVVPDAGEPVYVAHAEVRAGCRSRAPRRPRAGGDAEERGRRDGGIDQVFERRLLDELAPARALSLSDRHAVRRADLVSGDVSGYLGQSLLKLAIERGLIDVHLHNIRDWAHDKHHTVDDRPFGGGPGMVLKVEPVVECVEAVRGLSDEPGHLVMLTPHGRRLDQQIVEELAGKQAIDVVVWAIRGVRRTGATDSAAR